MDGTVMKMCDRRHIHRFESTELSNMNWGETKIVIGFGFEDYLP